MLEPRIEEAIEAAIARNLRGLHTACVGNVESYDESTQRATIKLGVAIDGVTVDSLPEVPVTSPGAWAAGHPVLCVFSEQDISGWVTAGYGGTPAAPALARRHGYYAVAVPLAALPGDAVDFVAIASKVDAQLNALKDAISNAVPVAQDGGVALQQSIVAALTGWPGSVASSALKAKT